jgi:hypothetical protein
MLRVMPEIEITPEQQERLRALQEDLARDVVGKYGHVRPRDAVEYLLDRYDDDDETSEGEAPPPSEPARDAEAGSGTEATPGADGVAESGAGAATESSADATARVVADDGDAADGAEAASDGTSSGGDAMLNEMMNLLDTHEDRWGESSGDERYAVELPDGSTEQVRTKDDVKALLFKHYR